MHLFPGSGWWQEPWSRDIAPWRSVPRLPRGLCNHSPSVELESAQGHRGGTEMKQHLEWLFWSSVPLLEVTSCLQLQLAEQQREGVCVEASLAPLQLSSLPQADFVVTSVVPPFTSLQCLGLQWHAHSFLQKFPHIAPRLGNFRGPGCSVTNVNV